MAKMTGKDYREKNRIRLQRFYEKQAASGKKRVSVVIPAEMHEFLMAEKKKTGSTISEIIEAVLQERFKTSGSKLQGAEPQSDNAPRHTEPVTQPGEAYADIIPDCAGKILNTSERDEMVIKVMEALPGSKNVQARLDLLNSKSVPVNTKSAQYGGTWTRENLKDNLKWIKKRLKEK